MKRLVILTLAILAIALPAMGGDLFIDFENYAEADLNGQQGWSAGTVGNWNVVSGSLLNGGKYLRGFWYSGASVSVAGTTFADGTVASVLAKPWFGLAPDQTSNSTLQLVNSAGSIYAGILLNDENFVFFLNQTATEWINTGMLYTDNTLKLSATLNFTSQTWNMGFEDLTTPANSFTIDGIAFTNGNTTPEQAANGKVVLGLSFTRFDDLSISTVPEPSALLALTTGLVGVCGFAVRRKR